MKKKIAKLMALLLTFSMVLCMDSSVIYALEADRDILADSVVEDVIGDDTAAADTISYEAAGEVYDEEPDEVTDDIQVVSDAPEDEVIAADGERVFYRNLTADEQEAKDSAEADVREVLKAEAGEDYPVNEVITLCGSEEEAGKIAGAYAKKTGYRVVVDSFQYGVAVLKIYGSPDTGKLKGYSALNSVETCVKLGADISNNLPAVYPNYVRHAYSLDTLNEEEFTDPMLKEDSEDYEGMYQWYHNKINDKFAWDKLASDSDFRSSLSNVHVAVLDSGINWEHTDLDSIVNSHQDFVNAEDEDDYEDDGGDTNGHGTNVAGIIGNVANTIGGRGVAAGVKIDSYRVLGRQGKGNDDDIIAGFRKAVEDKQAGTNIRVINMSLGSNYYSGAFEDVIKAAYEAGILIVAAAGNDNTSAYNYPASYEGVTSVASLNGNYEKSDFSNYGDRVDIAAPGGEGKIDTGSPTFYKTQPLWASGMKESDDDMRIVDGQNYSGMNGTSQATPVVAASAAMVFAKNPEWTPDYVEALLEATARPVKSKVQIGAGCVDIAAALDIDTAVPAPVTDEYDEAIPSGTTIRLQMPDGYAYTKYTTIYYTENGNEPLDPKTRTEDVKVCKPDDLIELEGTGKISICLQARVFGVESPSVTYNYTLADSEVSRITVKAGGNYEAYADWDGHSGALLNTEAYVALGKTITFKASVEPEYARNKNVLWSSDNPDVVTVDPSGRVKGINLGSTYVHARSSDGDTDVSIPVTVVNTPEQLVIADDIELTIGSSESYYFSEGEIAVYPSAGTSQRYILSSSDPGIAKISEDESGNQYIEAVAPGETTVKATTADGSALSDSVTVSVGSIVKKIDISDPSGLDIMIKGKTIIPQIILNDGQIVTGDDSVVWELVSPGELKPYFRNVDNGILILDTYGGSLPKDIVVRAKDQVTGTVYSNDLSLTLYEQASGIKLSELGKKIVDPTDFEHKIKKGDTIYLPELFEVINKDRSFLGLHFSSKRGSVTINDGGYAYFTGTGTVTIHAETVDGSEEYYDLNLNIVQNDACEGIRLKSGNTVLYPGKSVELEAIFAGQASWQKFCRFFMHLEDDTLITENDNIKINDKKVIGKNQISAAPGAKQTIGFYSYNFITGYYDQISTIAVELYPAETRSVVLEYRNSIGEKSDDYILNPGETGRITASSLPAGTCQKYYTYRSSNTGVLTVDNIGRIRAVSNGKASVTVTAGDGSNKSAKLDFVVAQAAAGIDIASKTNTFTVIPGKSLDLTAKFTPADTVDKSVKWEIISGEALAGINSKTGKLTAKNPGTVTVKATATANGVYDTQDITIMPATKSIIIDTAYKKGLNLYKQNIGSCSDAATFGFAVESVSGGTAQAPKVTSSDDKLFRVEQTGSVSASGNTSLYTYKVMATGDKAGKGKLNITATDGSGKKASLNVNVLLPVIEVNISSSGDVFTVTPGKSIKLSASTNKDASNKGIKWAFYNDSDKETAKSLGINTAMFEKNGTLSSAKTASGKGGFYVVATAQDGSGSYDRKWIDVRPKPVTSVRIVDGGETAVTKIKLGLPSGDGHEISAPDFALEKDLTVKVISDGSAEGDFQHIAAVSSSNESIVRAELDLVDRTKIHVYTYKEGVYRASKSGKATITVRAADGSGKSAKLNVVVSEPVRKIYISADKTARDIAANAKITMKAAVNSNASNKNVIWSLTDEFGNNLSDTVATISAKGTITPNKELAARTTIKAVATAADGSGTTSDPEEIRLYPAQGLISFLDASVPVINITMSAGDTKHITVKGESEDVCNDYAVTYKTGPVKICYEEKDADVTKIYITALKKGTTTVTATSGDGSGKKATLKITVE